MVSILSLSRVLLLLVFSCLIVTGCGKSKDLGVFEELKQEAEYEDSIILHRVTSLEAQEGAAHGEIKVSWVAPGADAKTYDLRYSTSTINGDNFDGATQFVGEPAPKEAGTPQEAVSTGFMTGINYYFAMVVKGPNGKRSDLSNVAVTYAKKSEDQGKSAFVISGKAYKEDGKTPVENGYKVTVINERNGASYSSSSISNGIYSISIVDTGNANVVYTFDKLVFSLRDQGNGNVASALYKAGTKDKISGSPNYTVTSSNISSATLGVDIHIQ